MVGRIQSILDQANLGEAKGRTAEAFSVSLMAIKAKMFYGERNSICEEKCKIVKNHSMNMT